MKLLLNNNYVDYVHACKHFNVQTLKERRENICLKFARKEMSKEESLFKKFTANRQTRQSKNTLVEEIYCHTDRYFKSSIPYLSRLLNRSKNLSNTASKWLTTAWWTMGASAKILWCYRHKLDIVVVVPYH